MKCVCISIAAVLAITAVAAEKYTASTSVMMRTTATATKVGTATSDAYFVKLTAEIVVQTNGVRNYVYRDIVYRIEKNGTTNVVADRSMQELPADTPKLNIEGVRVPDLGQLFHMLTNMLTQEQPPPPPPPPPALPTLPDSLAYAYDDTLAIDALGKPNGTGPVLSDTFGVADPLERYWNRPMFWFDGVLYVGILRPVGKGYEWAVPTYVRQGVRRMDYNIEFPRRTFCCLLQAKMKGAGIEFSRFLVNTTVGLVGFYDPATDWLGMPTYDEDFGQVFGAWGVGPGCYLYVPLVLQGGTVRDGVGAVFDSATDPRGALGFVVPGAGAAAVILFKFNNMTLDIDMYDRIKDENFDSYTYVRDMWYLVRTAKIAD